MVAVEVTTSDKTLNSYADNAAKHHAQLGNDVVVSTNKVRTPGWRLFDFFAHWVNNYGLNVAASLVTANDSWNYQVNKAIDRYKETNGREGFNGEKKRLLLGKASEWLFGTALPWVEKGTSKFWGTVLPKSSSGEDKYKYVRKQAIGVSNGVILLSFGGHATTLIAQFFETPAIKKRLVRWLDKYVTDPIRKLFGKGPTERELKEREAIYYKLDNELSGKSMIGMWSSRFAGIGMVIISMFTLGLVDKWINPFQYDPNQTPEENDKRRDQYEENVGFGRAPQAFFRTVEKLSEAGVIKKPAFLEPNKPGQFLDSEGRNKAQYMARMAALEIVGTSITSVTQYLYLMMREFFGVGPKTNIDNSKKKDKRAAANSNSGNVRTQEKYNNKAETQEVTREQVQQRNSAERENSSNSADLQNETTRDKISPRKRKPTSRETSSVKDNYREAVRSGSLSRSEHNDEVVIA